MSEPIRLACMPVELDEREKRIAEQVKTGGFVPYKGSVKGYFCKECGREVWVGPKQQGKILECLPEQVHIFCIACAAKHFGSDAQIKSLSRKRWPDAKP